VEVVVIGGVLAVLAAACGGGTSSPNSDGGATTVASQSTTSPESGDGATPATTTGVVAGGDDGSCTVTTSGDRQDSWTFPQAVTSFSTDYWLSEENLRETVEFLGEDIAGGSYDELVARGEPIITLLSISCSDPDNLIQGVLVTPGNATRAADLPMGPGSYPISGGLFDAGEVPAGAMIADFSVNEDELYGTLPDSGSLEITRWDLDRIEGSVSFDARQSFVDTDPKQVSVAVEFSFRCPGQGIFTRC
jgi:hypothetical protein